MRGARATSLVAAASVVVFATCAAPTQILVEVHTGMDCARRPQVGVFTAPTFSDLEQTSALTSTSAACAPAEERVGTLVLQPSGARDESVVFLVATRNDDGAPESCTKASGYKGCVVARRRVRFVPNESLRLRVDLRASCIDVPCGSDETCVDGVCADATVPDGCAARPDGCGESALRSLGGGEPAGDAGVGDPGSDAGAPPLLAQSHLALGAEHSCARIAGGVKCWGGSLYGQLGLGDQVVRGDGPGEMGAALPYVKLGSDRSARTLAAGEHHTCVILDDGRVKCWGLNNYGQLGLGDKASRGDDPGEMGDALPFVDLGAGRRARALAAGENHTCAILDDGRVKCWGYGGSPEAKPGRLGVGDGLSRGDGAGQMGDALPAVDLGAGRSAIGIAAGKWHTCAILDTQQVKCWGNNQFGQLGIGDALARGDGPNELGDALPAVQLGAGRSARAVAAGNGYTCALLDGGQVKCWGGNASGQLGIGDTVARGTLPGQLGDTLEAIDLGAGRSAKALTTGDGYTCALLDDGQIRCWGYNAGGRLALGDETDRGDDPNEMGDLLRAVQLGDGPGARDLATGATHSCAAFLAGLKCWGTNAKGQLGLGDTTSRIGAVEHMGNFLPLVELGP